ncbi:MAG: hypothetical protein R3362_05685 [Rhodothermales bacterium]|nr:hypothetical protein [Rhodothermales bacterium]
MALPAGVYVVRAVVGSGRAGKSGDEPGAVRSVYTQRLTLVE